MKTKILTAMLLAFLTVVLLPDSFGSNIGGKNETVQTATVFKAGLKLRWMWNLRYAFV